MRPQDLGTATIEPQGSFPVSTTGTWTLVYTVGKFGIDDGGSIIVVQRPLADATRLQTEESDQPGYVKAVTDGCARLRVSFQKRYWIRPCKDAIVVTCTDGSLTPGEHITVTMGDTSGGGPGWSLQTFPETEHQFHVLVDAFGTREYYPVPEPPSIRIVPGPPALIDAILPSRAPPSTPVDLHVRMTDAWHNPLDEFTGRVAVFGKEWSREFNMAAGVQAVGKVSFDRPGVHRLELSCGELHGRSNPVVVSDDAPTLVWADMHGQTEATVGTGSVEEYFRFARDKALIDVAGWQGNDFQVTDVLWHEVCRQTKSFNQSGRFVTFLGYEWSGLTPAGGDHNILFLHDDQRIHRSSHWQIHDGSGDETDRYPLSELWGEFRGRDDVMAIAHVGGRYANLGFWHDGISGLIEVHSHHGTFEWLLDEALERGLLFGVVGQSDDHSGRPGFSAPLRSLPRDFATFDAFGGLTGVYAERLDRESIWKALRARHCYATTGNRMVLDVRCGDAIMGDVVAADGPVRLEVTAAGSAPLLDVELYRDREVLHRHAPTEKPDENWVRIEWSGVRIKSRNKIAEWPITVAVDGAAITEHRLYGFPNPDETAEQVGRSKLKVTSRTSGDARGVFVKLSDKRATLAFTSPRLSREVRVAGLEHDPVCMPADGVNLLVQISSRSPEGQASNVSFTVKDDVHLPGRHAYWARVLQSDGHRAWSSPIFVSHDKGK